MFGLKVERIKLNNTLINSFTSSYSSVNHGIQNIKDNKTTRLSLVPMIDKK